MSGARTSRPDPRAAALDVLIRVEQGGWSDRLLAAREPTLAEARDRRFLHQLVLSALRWQLALDPLIAPHVRAGLHRIRPAARAALRLAAVEVVLLGKPAPVAVDAVLTALRAVDGPKPVGLVNAVARRALEGEPPVPAARASLPDWLWRRWSGRMGEPNADALAAAINRPGRPFVVARRDRGGREAIAAALAGEGVTTEPSGRHPDGLYVVAGALQGTGPFERGDVIPVNEASALVARLAAPWGPGPVADLAAAPGGKAACLCQEAGEVVAGDVHPGRVRHLARQLGRRAPAGRGVAVRANALAPPLSPGRFAAILLDAPCSGTGTLRGRPEIRHRLTPKAVRACAELQARMLDAAAELPAPGGSLTYAVCSLEPEEGEEQLRAFLARRPSFEAEDPVAILGPACRDLVAGDPPALVSRPAEGDHDGFYAARLVRR